MGDEDADETDGNDDYDTEPVVERIDFEADEIGYEGEESGDAEDEQVIAQGRAFFGFLFFCFFFLDVSGDGFFVLCHRFLCFGISLFFFRYFIFPFPARDEFIDLDGDRQGNKEGEIDPDDRCHEVG